MQEPSRLRQLSYAEWSEGRIDAAMDAAWDAYHLAPDDLESKVWVARLLRRFREKTAADKRAALLRLIEDPEVDPAYVALAGWNVVTGGAIWKIATESGDFQALANALETDELVQALLREAPVYSRAAERELAKMRRWLLMTGEWRRHQRLIDALVAQAALNGGAWPFDEAESALLDEAVELPIFAAYLPRRDAASPERTDIAQPLMRAVAED